MTLRELLDTASPGTWVAFEDAYGYHVENGLHEYTLGRGESVYADTRLFALAPELAALVLDMADALDMVRGALRFEEDQAAFDAEILPLLARLDRISTQTERSHALADERAAWAGAIGTPEAGDCNGRSSAPVSSGEAPGRSVCVCDPPDQVFSRTLCACGAMHTYCGKCGEQLDDCDPDPCCEDAGDCGEDCGTA